MVRSGVISSYANHSLLRAVSQEPTLVSSRGVAKAAADAALGAAEDEGSG